MMVYTLSIGSNVQRAANMALARRRLTELFPGIRFSHEMETQPFCFRHSGLFSNQVARFASEASAGEITAQLKAIECEAGRTPGEKEKEVVRLDIDLLACDAVVYKPADWKRDYVQQGVEELESPP